MKNLLSLVCFLSAVGCVSFSDRAMRPVAKSIQEQSPHIHLEKEFGMSIGDGMFNLIELGTAGSDSLADMNHVRVAVYKVAGSGQQVDFDAINLKQTLKAENSRLHWEIIVRVRKPEEQVWVLVGMDLQSQTLSEVAVFKIDQNELVLINVDGELDNLLRFAMQPAREHRESIHH